MAKSTSDNLTTADALLGMVVGAPRLIDMQEKQGQAEVCSDDQLPTSIDPSSKLALENAGVVFGDRVEGDDMFTHVTLPAGWKKVHTDHPMWSNLVDEHGGVRASIFYKAAFYDRDAFMRTNERLTANYTQWDDWGRNNPAFPIIQSGGDNILWIGAPVDQVDGKVGEEFGSDVTREMAQKVLDDAFPELTLANLRLEKMRLESKSEDKNYIKLRAEIMNMFWDMSSDQIKEVLPESKGSAPKGDKYSLRIEIFRDAGCYDYVDGGTHDACTCETDEEAIGNLVPKAMSMAQNYGACKWWITVERKAGGDGAVSSGTEVNPNARHSGR